MIHFAELRASDGYLMYQHTLILGPSLVTVLISPPSDSMTSSSLFKLVTNTTSFPSSPLTTSSTLAPDPVENSTTPWSPVYPDPEKCNYFISNKNTTEYFRFSNPYGGIPQVAAFVTIL
jgi:hypothetical protein